MVKKNGAAHHFLNGQLNNRFIFYVVSIIVIILAVTSYLIVKSQEIFLLKLIKQNTIQYSDIVRRSVKHHMLENQPENVKRIIENIGSEEQISEIRIFNKEGKIIVSSLREKIGVLVDTKSEGCINCHGEGRKPVMQKELTRIYKTQKGERFIGVMQPIYNEKACFRCHSESKKILGVLDVVLSLKEIDKEIYKNKRIMLLFFIITIFAISIIVAKSTYDFSVINRKLEDSYRKLQEISKVKSEFMRKVSNQLCAPISAIQSCIRVVLDGYVTSDKQIDMLQRVENRTKSLILMINDLLDLAKIEELKEIKYKERIDLNELLTKVVAFIREKAESKKINLSLRIENSLPVIFARYDEIEGAIMNIIDNAIKYTIENGSVEVTAKVDKEIKIEIKDSGIGIPKEKLPFIFDEFYRANNVVEYEKDGTGLGLAIAKKTIELYEGKIEVESILSQGTKFTISFPI